MNDKRAENLKRLRLMTEGDVKSIVGGQLYRVYGYQFLNPIIAPRPPRREHPDAWSEASAELPLFLEPNFVAQAELLADEAKLIEAEAKLLK